MRTLVTTTGLVLVLALAGCGGAGVDAPDAATTGTGDATPAPVSDAPATDPAAPTPDAGGATPAPTTEGGAGTGGFAGRPCDLVSQSDAEAAAGVGGLTQSVLQVDATSGICTYQDAAKGIEVYAGVWERAVADQQWTTMEYLVDTGTPDMERVDGLGGDAIYSTNGSVLMVRKGDTLVQLSIRNPDLDAAANKAAVLALGRAVLGRM